MKSVIATPFTDLLARARAHPYFVGLATVALLALLLVGLVAATTLRGAAPAFAYVIAPNWRPVSAQAVCPGAAFVYPITVTTRAPAPVVYDADAISAALARGEVVPPLLNIAPARLQVERQVRRAGNGEPPMPWAVAGASSLIAVDATRTSTVTVDVPADAAPGLYYVVAAGWVTPEWTKGSIVWFLVRTPNDCL